MKTIKNNPFSRLLRTFSEKGKVASGGSTVQSSSECDKPLTSESVPVNLVNLRTSASSGLCVPNVYESKSGFRSRPITPEIIVIPEEVEQEHEEELNSRELEDRLDYLLATEGAPSKQRRISSASQYSHQLAQQFANLNKALCTKGSYSQAKKAAESGEEIVLTPACNKQLGCGLILQRLGLRMYVVLCNNNTICQPRYTNDSIPNMRFGDEIIAINGKQVTKLSHQDACAEINQALQQNGSCNIVLCRQPLTNTLVVEPKFNCASWQDGIPDGQMIISINGENTVGVPNGRLTRMVAAGGVVEYLDAIVFDSLIQEVSPKDIAAAAWNGARSHHGRGTTPLLSVPFGDQ